MKFKMIHENYNVSDLDRSIKFYNEALDLQLIPVNIIAYRSQYGSVNPAVILAPSLVATLLSAVTAAVFCKLMDRG